MKILKKALPYTLALGTLLPLAALAQAPSSTYINALANLLSGPVVAFLLVIATIVFIWGVIMFLTAGADEERRANARSLMIYGLIALFVIVAVWGIVNVLVDFFGVGGENIPTGIGGT